MSPACGWCKRLGMKREEDEQRAREILPGALERSGEERQTWLLKMCGQDDELLTRVRQLLGDREQE
ncbi:MAG: hypothetical protein VCA55_07460, partial [Verrucomicrobiales bacterium]